LKEISIILQHTSVNVSGRLAVTIITVMAP